MSSRLWNEKSQSDEAAEDGLSAGADAAWAAAEAAAFARELYASEFVPAQPPTYQTKARGAQEAHEAIRPTSGYL